VISGQWLVTSEIQKAEIMKRLLTIAMLVLLSSPAMAHTGHGTHGLLGGLIHPLTGADHLLAMLAVGIWAGSLGGRALWAGPASFVAAMLAGFALALAGFALPMVEPGIAVSVLVLGLMVAFAVQIRPVYALPVIALFAIGHGYAHGTELAGGAIAFASGMLVSTAVLHLAGAGLGHYVRGKVMPARQAMGSAITAVGALMLTGVI
jgi:urease accessory protein